jgi:hypothetical protein
MSAKKSLVNLITTSAQAAESVVSALPTIVGVTTSTVVGVVNSVGQVASVLEDEATLFATKSAIINRGHKSVIALVNQKYDAILQGHTTDAIDEQITAVTAAHKAVLRTFSEFESADSEADDLIQ